MAGMFHTCKPSWDEENTRIRAELERWKSACGEYYQAKEKLAGELKEANLQISELKKHWATRAAFEVLVKKVDETSRLNGEYRAALQRIHKLMTDTISAGEGVCNRVYEIAEGALTEKPKCEHLRTSHAIHQGEVHCLDCCENIPEKPERQGPIMHIPGCDGHDLCECKPVFGEKREVIGQIGPDWTTCGPCGTPHMKRLMCPKCFGGRP